MVVANGRNAASLEAIELPERKVTECVAPRDEVCIMVYMNTNSNLHFLVTTNNGETFGEKARNSFGSHVNLTRRVSKRLGGVDARCTETAPDEFTFFVVDADHQPTGASFTTQEVNKL